MILTVHACVAGAALKEITLYSSRPPFHSALDIGPRVISGKLKLGLSLNLHPFLKNKMTALLLQLNILVLSHNVQ